MREVPRVAGQTQTVPAKDGSKTPVQADKGGLGGAAQPRRIRVRNWSVQSQNLPLVQAVIWIKAANLFLLKIYPPPPSTHGNTIEHNGAQWIT
jgi:hypothetical protein